MMHKMDCEMKILYRKQGNFRWAKVLWCFRRVQKCFSHESFALSTTYKHPGLALQKYYRENPYNMNTMKV